MISKNMWQAQQYLTINDGFTHKRILDVVAMSITHDLDEIIMHLCELYVEKHDHLARIIADDNTSIMLDLSIGALFRLSQAITHLQQPLTEGTHESERRTDAGGTSCAGHRGRNRGPGVRQDRHNAA